MQNTVNTTSRAPLDMRGNRFKPLTWDALSPAQLKMADDVMAGKRGSMQGPYNVLLRSPELGNLAQKFGEHTRFESSLPLVLNELAILMVARFWTCQFVWWAHRQIACEAGLDEALIQAIASGTNPQNLPADIAAIHDFCDELLKMRAVSDGSYAAAVKLFGEAGVVDLMGAMGYYMLVCMTLNVDQYPLPDGVMPELKPLR